LRTERGGIRVLTKETTMAKKPSLTQRWMLDHPDDVPCPRNPAAAWRLKRGLARSQREIRKRYEAAMAETRAWRAKQAEAAHDAAR